MRGVFVVALATWAATTASCGRADRAVTGGRLRVAGSDTARPAVQAAADTFATLYARATIEVGGGGSVLGLEDLFNRKADVAMLSRSPSAREREAAKQAGVELALYPFAKDGLALVTHPGNPVFALALDEARDIFLGRTLDWSEVGGRAGPINLYVTDEASGSIGTLRDSLLAGADVFAGARRLRTTREVVLAVAADTAGFGYAGMAEVGVGVKALPLSGRDGGPLTPLTAETVYRKSYPLCRTFYFATRGIPRDNLASGFVSFVMSTSGQAILRDHGFLPATVPVRIRHEGDS